METRSKYWIFAILLFIGMRCFALDVQVQGLFKGAAVLLIDGKQRLLRAGKRSPEGVLLIHADRKHAIVEIQGKRHDLSLSRRITSSYQAVEKIEVAIPRNATNQYISNAMINGKRIKVLVDTGATSVALSSKDAERLNIDYQNGQKSQVVTASGVAKAYTVLLKRISVGGLTVSGVSAVVIEGAYPVTVLLGMTYLNHVSLREQGGTLYLKSKY
ncbi:MAG: TIGR02281 family clan AA aspartic protease [Spongiibacteraceae bacterium]|nr:TIGR02281 family clan AA aspartic protease [Spongiibacteraceae bacterium]